MKIPISEIYPAVQCEGLHKTPALFIRVWGCNLRCGFTCRKDGKTVCDTPYAVFEGDKTLMETSQIIKEIKEYNIPHIVFTGGEPLMYQRQIVDIIEQLGDVMIEIETNGTVIPCNDLLERVNQFNISVKLKSSNQWKGYNDKRINEEALKTFTGAHSIFKFVITDVDDIKEVQYIRSINPDIEVYLMPKGATRKEIIENTPIVLDLCMRYNYGFTNRDHIIAYGDKRGV